MTTEFPLVPVIIALGLVAGLFLLTVAGACKCPRCGRWHVDEECEL